MANISPLDTLINRGILVLLGVLIAGLYVGAQIVPHPDFSGSKAHKSDHYETEKPQKTGAASAPGTSKGVSRGESVQPVLLESMPENQSIELAYGLPAQGESAVIPAVFLPTMPADMSTLPVQERKQLFIRILLPLIASANNDILVEQAELARADAEALEAFAKSYRVKSEDLDISELRAELEKRIKPIPVSLALAQAAIESGWGTSRFTKEANALYGQWAWRPEDGVKPLEASNSRAVIRKFDTLKASVSSYMKNLNTHYAYSEFRDGRAKALASSRPLDVLDLAQYLENYAEIGDEYVDTIRSVIRRNQFVNFDKISLAGSSLES